MNQPTPTASPDGWLSGSLRRRRGVLAGLGLVAASLVASQGAWGLFGPAVARSERYLVRPADVSITPLPAWVRVSPIAAAEAASGWPGDLSLLDPPQRLERPLAELVARTPWVRRVVAVRKSPPNRVHVEVEYRQPIAAALLAGGLVPIDAEGVLLPARDLAREFVVSLPRVGVASDSLEEPNPFPLSGDRWPAEAVAGAASIALALGPAFAELRLVEVQIDPSPEVRAGVTFTRYRLRSMGNTLVLWGAAPGRGPADEAATETKVARLRESVQRFGPLDSVETGPAVIDVRDGVEAYRRVVLRDKNRLAAKPPEGEESGPIK